MDSPVACRTPWLSSSSERPQACRTPHKVVYCEPKSLRRKFLANQNQHREKRRDRWFSGSVGLLLLSRIRPRKGKKKLNRRLTCRHRGIDSHAGTPVSSAPSLSSLCPARESGLDTAAAKSLADAGERPRACRRRAPGQYSTATSWPRRHGGPGRRGWAPSPPPYAPDAGRTEAPRAPLVSRAGWGKKMDAQRG